MSTASDIKRAIRDLLAEIDGGTLVPTTTLTADVSIGATTASIAPILTTNGVSRIRAGMPFQFHDAANETLFVQSVSTDGRTVTFDQPAASLHTNTTTVYTNLTAFSPLEPGALLVLGDPAIFISARRRTDSQDEAYRAIWPTYRVELYYFRTFSQPSDSSIPAIRWQEEQEDACTSDLDRIATYLLKHQQLIGPFTTAAAVKFAPLNSASNLIETVWDWDKAEQADVWLYTGIMRVNVAATGVSL